MPRGEQGITVRNSFHCDINNHGIQNITGLWDQVVFCLIPEGRDAVSVL